MSSFTFDCPNCSAKKSTFDVSGYELRETSEEVYYWYLFSTCRACKISVTVNADLTNNRIQFLYNSYSNSVEAKIAAVCKKLNDIHDISDWFEDFVYSPILPNAETPPEHLPAEINSLFNEAAQCYAIGCYNASGAMFRLCLDITTKDILNKNENLNPTSNDKRTIHSRLTWIFNNNILPRSLEDLSRCIKDDGNDAAHDGSLCKEDAADLLDFTYILLERIYTEPVRILNASQRRVERRQA